MSTVTVSIGRNVGSAPLDAIEWSAFKEATRNLVLDATSRLFVDSAWSVGRWDGVEEESCTFVGEAYGPAVVIALHEALAGLARRFQQDAIAITSGTTFLAGLDRV